MRIALLVILAGISYALGVWALLHRGEHLAPGVTPKDLAAPGGPGGEELDRLASLYTPRGAQLTLVGMVLSSVCALGVILALIDLVSRLPAIMDANTIATTNMLVREVSTQRPNILLVWVAESILAGLGFLAARSRPLLAIPFAALAIIWFFDLTGGFLGPHGHLIGTRSERSDMLQIALATAIVLFATGQGMRAWMVRHNKQRDTNR